MPWKDCCTMSLREEFVTLTRSQEANISSLCRRFHISRKTGYKWMARFAKGGREALHDGARRPRSSPRRCDEKMEQAIAEVRRAHPAWGGRKIRRVLINRGQDALQLPAPSTIGQVLRRRGLIDAVESDKHRAFVRFEHEQPNDLWQMDFKGHVALQRGGRCHPLTVLDDHSRFNLMLRACGDETLTTVRPILIELFERYGQPQRILCDNGAPWGSSGGEPYTLLGVWLMRHGIGITHGRPHHPQTQGKEERFHRTLVDELLRRRAPAEDLPDAQQRFDPWRDEYNHVRPHEAIGMATPASRYRPSTRAYQASPPPPQYDRGVAVRKVDCIGKISYRGNGWRIGKAFVGQPIGLAATEVDGLLRVLLSAHEIGQLDLRAWPAVKVMAPTKARPATSPPASDAGPSLAALAMAQHREEQSVTYVSEHV